MVAAKLYVKFLGGSRCFKKRTKAKSAIFIQPYISMDVVIQGIGHEFSIVNICMYILNLECVVH